MRWRMCWHHLYHASTELSFGTLPMPVLTYQVGWTFSYNEWRLSWHKVIHILNAKMDEIWTFNYTFNLFFLLPPPSHALEKYFLLLLFLFHVPPSFPSFMQEIGWWYLKGGERNLIFDLPRTLRNLPIPCNYVFYLPWEVDCISWIVCGWQGEAHASTLGTVSMNVDAIRKHHKIILWLCLSLMTT